MPVTARILSAGLSDVGRKRRENEDRIHIDAERGIYLVVDGLGGHAAGERAAETAVDMISTRLARQTGSTEERIREAFAVANNEIHELASRNTEWSGMACVATLAVLEDDHVTVGHVGDSRLYLLEPGSIRKITNDHSPVGEMEDAGTLTEAAAMAHPRRNEVFRDLGGEPHTPDDPEFVEVHRFRLGRASALLLCSDGLSDQVPSDAIRATVEKHAGDPQSAVRDLVAAANEAGGKDNVSIVLVEMPDYRPVQARTAAAPARRGLPGLVWFVIGLTVAALLVAALQPYLAETTAGRELRYGTARGPLDWRVGPNAIPTVSEALARARSGDTITVANGVYREAIQLRAGVTLAAAELHGAKIEAPSGAVVTAENIQGARLAGFVISGPGDVGIRIANARVEITDVQVTGMRNAGIEIEETPTTSIRGCQIINNPGTGIFIHGAAHATIHGNLITGNGKTPGNQRPGIHIAGTAAPTITGNIIRENAVEQIWASPLFNDPGLLSRNAIGDGKSRVPQVKVVTR